MNGKTNIEVNGVIIANVRRMASKFPGVDSLTFERFPAGTEIVFKRLQDMTKQEVAAVFGDRQRKYNLSLMWRDSYNPVVKETKDFEPSKYQRQILDFFLNHNDQMVVEALAGSGKTSTMVWLLKTAYKAGATKGLKIITMAFNTGIRDELNVQLAGTGISAVTTHQFGYSVIREQVYNGVRLSKNKDYFAFMDLLCAEHGLEPGRESYKAVRKTKEAKLWSAVKQIVSFTKNTAILPDNVNGKLVFGAEKRKEISDLIDQYEISWEKADAKIERSYVINLAVEVIKTSFPKEGEALRQITFDDMLYLPLALNLTFPKYDVVIVDEAQDLNKCQITFLTLCVTESGRVITVGDRNQSIYKFRGADSRAIDRICEIIGKGKKIDRLELPVNYRCDANIISHAQRLVPSLQGFKKELGVAANISFNDAIERANNNQTDIELNDGIDGAPRKLTNCSFCFLCRTNVPLVITAYELIKNRKRAKVLGRNEIAQPMINLIKELCEFDEDGKNAAIECISDIEEGGVSYDGLMTRLNDYERIQVRKLQEEGYEHQVDEIQQRCECIRVISTKVTTNSVYDVLKEIDELFDDDDDSEGTIILSTGHKAKGREWNVVFVLRPDLLPHPLAKPNSDGSWSEDQQQEKNLHYVIDTRPKNRLYYVRDWPFSGGKPLSYDGPAEDADSYADEKSSEAVESKSIAPDTLAAPEYSAADQFVDDGEPF